MRKPTVTATADAPPPVERTITLTMNEDVARTLYELMRHVAGDFASSRRGHADAIQAALRDQNVGRGPASALGTIEFGLERVDA